jgi:hypothetical protein
MKLNVSTLVIFACLIAILSVDSNVQWIRTNGPYGGNVTALASIGSNIFLETDGNGAFL